MTDMILESHRWETLCCEDQVKVTHETFWRPPASKMHRLVVEIRHQSEMPYNSPGEIVDGQTLDHRLHGDFLMEEYGETDGWYTEVYCSTGEVGFDC